MDGGRVAFDALTWTKRQGRDRLRCSRGVGDGVVGALEMVCTALVSGRRSRKATARLLGKQDAGQAKVQVVGASPGSLASVVERMAESEAGRPFCLEGSICTPS